MNLFNDAKASSPIIGIDLGTTNSAVAVYNAGTVPTLLPIGKDGRYTVPSCVRWDGKNDAGIDLFTVGADAYKERYQPNVIYSIKRLMGSGDTVCFEMPDPAEDGAIALDKVPSNQKLIMTPAQVSAEILRYLKDRTAEFYMPVTDCVITVPAYFNQRQIGDTLEAAKFAGLNCKQILKEPTSASYIYSQLGHASTGSVLIYDLGGGTFDVTHMNFLRKDAVPGKLLTSLKRQYGIELDKSGADNNDQYFCRVLGTYGDVNLGGDDIDIAFAKILMKKQNLALSEVEEEQLYLACEEFKKSGIYGQDVPIGDHVVHMTGSDLDVAVDAIFERTLRIMDDIDMSGVKTIVLVGGSTKSQRIRDNLSRAFPGVEISAVLDPDATVALGAGSVAKAIANDGELMYADVLPLPIGVLVEEKKVDICIAKNTSMPHTTKKTYHTMHDNQTQITVHVYQGLSPDPKECTYLGRLTLTDIPKAPAGDVDVVVSFMLTGQGRLKIVSRIDGIDKEEELVIDNIFDVGNTEDAPNQTPHDGATVELSPLDSFEEVFLPMSKENEKALDLFRERRVIMGSQLPDDANRAKVQELEDTIVNLLI